MKLNINSIPHIEDILTKQVSNQTSFTEECLTLRKNEFSTMSGDLFRKILVLTGKNRKTYFVYKCLVAPEPSTKDPNDPEFQIEPSETVCNVKCGTFKSMVRHLVRKHKIYIPSAIVCQSCQIVLQNTCQAVAHYKQHLEQAVEIFNCEAEEFPCESCSTNKNLIIMIRSGVSCNL